MSDTSDEIYQELIMDRARHPRHAGRLDPFDAEAEGDNPMCGDRIKLRIRCDGGRIGALMHETRGCAICVAAADLMGEAVINVDVTMVGQLADRFEAMITRGETPDQSGLGELRALSGVHAYRSRHRCATLPWQALRGALSRTREIDHG